MLISQSVDRGNKVGARACLTLVLTVAVCRLRVWMRERVCQDESGRCACGGDGRAQRPLARD